MKGTLQTMISHILFHRRVSSATLILLLTAVFLSGCGGGVVGTTGYQRQYSPAESALNRAWEEFSLGHFANSIEEFNNVLTYTHTPSQEVDANLGLGWSYTRSTGIGQGGIYFLRALTNNQMTFNSIISESQVSTAMSSKENDAKIGLAGFLLSTAEPENMPRGVELLSSFGLDNVDYVYTPKRDYGMNNAKAHALMAALFNYTGEIEKAKAHARKAAELNVPPSEPPYNSVTQIVNWVESRQ